MNYTYWKSKYLELKERAKQEGYKVLLVYKQLANDYKGMNWLVDQSLHFGLAENEIWIDKSMNWKDIAITLNHELIEIPLLLQGIQYPEAHRIAQAKERQF